MLLVLLGNRFTGTGWTYALINPIETSTCVSFLFRPAPRKAHISINISSIDLKFHTVDITLINFTIVKFCFPMKKNYGIHVTYVYG